MLFHCEASDLLKAVQIAASLLPTKGNILVRDQCVLIVADHRKKSVEVIVNVKDGPQLRTEVRGVSVVNSGSSLPKAERLIGLLAEMGIRKSRSRRTRKTLWRSVPPLLNWISPAKMRMSTQPT